MASKIIAVSDDDITYHTLPGSSGDLNADASSADDTTFGAAFNSSQSTIVTWTASANAYYKGFAGYVANFKKTGTTTAFTGEAMTLVSGKTYKITDATKNIFDRTVALTVYDNAADVTAQVESVDHLFGRITFLGTYTVTGAVTIDGSYLPTTSVGTAKDYTLTMNADSVDTTSFAVAKANGGYSTFVPGLKTVSVDASGFYALSNGFRTLVNSRAEVIVEINPEGSNLSTARGFFKATSTGQSGDAGGNESETITFELAVPQSDTNVTKNVVTPFKWLHESTTTLHTSLQKVLTAWENGSLVYVKYLSDGLAGDKGQAVITDCSLSSAIDGVAEFSVSFQGSGATTTI